ncbi:DUF2612 domain-containing protein [Providencia rettgeri]
MNMEATIYRQYSTSKTIIGFIETFNAAVDLNDFTDEFIGKVWDVLTAESYGLDIWGKIVNVSRYQKGLINNDAFGFADGFMPFNTAPFESGLQETENVRLDNDAYRTLILAKAFTNISIATIQDLNRFLNMLFKGRGVAFCNNYQKMTIGITTDFDLAPYEVTILTNTDVMPIPSGVQISINPIVAPYFGFAADSYPFNEGNFYR